MGSKSRQQTQYAVQYSYRITRLRVVRTRAALRMLVAVGVVLVPCYSQRTGALGYLVNSPITHAHISCSAGRRSAMATVIMIMIMTWPLGLSRAQAR